MTGRSTNARFPQAPALLGDFHRRYPSATALNRIFRREETRTVGQDWVVRYHNRALQLARQSRYAPVTSCKRGSRRLYKDDSSGISAAPASTSTGRGAS